MDNVLEIIDLAGSSPAISTFINPPCALEKAVISQLPEALLLLLVKALAPLK